MKDKYGKWTHTSKKRIHFAWPGERQCVHNWWTRGQFACGAHAVSDVLQPHLESLRDQRGIQPAIYARSPDDVIARLVLVAPDHSHIEFCLYRATVVADLGVRTYAFSKRLPIAANADVVDAKKKQSPWMTELAGFKSGVTRTPLH